MAAASYMLWIFGSAPLHNQLELPTEQKADAYFTDHIKPTTRPYDPNDMIYAFEASRDYNPEPDLGSIAAPLFAINSADDQINPPEIGVMEREIGKVRQGRYILLPATPETRGHGTHTLPAIWGDHLRALLAASGGPAAP
jgi:homoserine O-acetyltransferase